MTRSSEGAFYMLENLLSSVQLCGSLMSTVYLDGVFFLPCQQIPLHGLVDYSAVGHSFPKRKKKHSDQIPNFIFTIIHQVDELNHHLPQSDGGRQYGVVELGALWL